MPTRRLAFASLVLVGLAVTAAPAAAPLTCRSGTAIYERYELQIREVSDRRNNGPIIGCARGRSRPTRLHFTEQGITTATTVLRRFGNRQALGFRYNADESGGIVAGWWDLRSGRAALTELGLTQDFPPDTHEVAVGSNGEIAVAAADLLDEEGLQQGWQILHKPFANGRFGRQRRISKIPIPDLDPRTLAVDGRTVTWRTQSERRSAAAPAATGVDPAPSPGSAPRGLSCSAGDTLYGDHSARLFLVRRPASKRGVYACRRIRRPRPMRIAEAPLRMRLIERRGDRISFLLPAHASAPTGALGWFHATQRRVAVAPLPAADKVGEVAALDVDPRTGSLAYLAADPAAPGDLLLGFKPSDGSRLQRDQVLARLKPAEVEPHTLRNRAGQVSWRVRGEPRSAQFPTA